MKTFFKFCLVIITIFNAIDANEARAQVVTQLQELVPSDFTSPNIGFGSSVDFYGDRMVIGGGLCHDCPSATYMFQRQGGQWVEVQRLLPVDHETGDYGWFGSLVAMHEDMLAISAYEILERDEPEYWQELGHPNVARGVVFLFQRQGSVWNQIHKFAVDHLSSHGNTVATFGQALALHGNTLAVASTAGSLGPSTTGAVFIYENQGGTWELTDQIFPPAFTSGDYLNAVALENDTLIVGRGSYAPWFGSAAYAYERVNGFWQAPQLLHASDGFQINFFGHSLSLSGDSLLISSQTDDDNGVRSGSVYEFERFSGAWIETQKIKPQVGGPDQYFGRAIKHNGETAIISEYDPYQPTETRVFKKLNGDWMEVTTLDRFPTDIDPRNGNSVGLQGNTFAVANSLYAPNHTLGNQGRVWIYTLSPATDDTTPTGTGVDVIPPVTDLDGQPVEGAPEFNFSFESIEVGGETTITIVDPSPETTTPPQGFSILGLGGGSALFDFYTTATMAPGSTVEICIDYSAMEIAGDPADLIFAHEVEGVWQNITSSNDVGQEIICGVTDSFSYFALFEVADPIALLEGLIQAVAALNAKHGIVNSLDSKLSAAKKALHDAKANNDLSAINVLMHSFINAVEAQRGNQILATEADQLIALAKGVVLAIEAAKL